MTTTLINSITDIDSLLHEIYEVYVDFVLKVSHWLLSYEYNFEFPSESFLRARNADKVRHV